MVFACAGTHIYYIDFTGEVLLLYGSQLLPLATLASSTRSIFGIVCNSLLDILHTVSVYIIAQGGSIIGALLG